MGRGIKKNLIFIIILAIGAAISGLIIVTTSCSVDMLDYIEEKIALDEAGEIDVFSGILYRDMVSVSGVTGDAYTQTDGTESFVHNISDFSIARYEVTYELWYMVHNWAISNGYTFENSGKEGHDGTAGAAPTGAKYEPVTTINWRDIIIWCNAYSEISGFTPVYENGSGLLIKDSRDGNAAECDGAVPDWTNNGYRLPTEGEWQYAASNKGDTSWNYASGADNSIGPGQVAWYEATADERTHIVGTTDNPSALTLWDMSGNVFELCWDWDGDYPGTKTDYHGPSSGSARVTRGGGWYGDADSLQLGIRGYYDPGIKGHGVGFRMASKQ